MFRMPCLLNDQRCSSHCLDTSARWTVARHISARHRWNNVDTRPAKPSIPSVGKDSRDELVDGLLVSGALRPGDSLYREEQQKATEHPRARDCNVRPGGCSRPIDNWKEDIRIVNADTRSPLPSLLYKDIRVVILSERATRASEGPAFPALIESAIPQPDHLFE